MFKESEIRTFVDGTTTYFEVTAQQAASVGSPYLVTDGNPGAYEYTGVIGISGARKGMVYFTAPRGMLTVLLMRMQETDTSDESIRDEKKVTTPHARSFVIPINWRTHSAKLVVCLE